MGETAETDDFEAIRKIEEEALRQRQGAWGMSQQEPIGLALSGGGIRSATFGLGVLRELSALRLLHRFDYLSTVSGGAYAGAFLCGLFVGRAGQDPLLKPRVELKDPLGTQPAQGAIRLLRESGRYLAPAGGLDYWFAAVIVIRNWLGLQLILGSIVFAVGLFGIGLRFVGDRTGLDIPFKILGLTLSFGPMLLAALLLLAVNFCFGWAYWLTRRDLGSAGGRGWWAVGATCLVVLLCLAMGEFLGLAAWISAAIGIGALLVWFKCLLDVNAQAVPNQVASALEQSWDARRLWLARIQARLSRAAVLLAVFALADALGFALAGRQQYWPAFVSFPALSALVVPLTRFLLDRTNVMKPLGRIARRFPMALWLKVLAAALLTLLVLFWEALAYRLAWASQVCFPQVLGGTCGSREAFTIAFVVSAILWVGIAGTPSLLNLSSLATFYAGRLRRAYLGAGNPKRQDDPTGVDRGVEGDDIGLAHYYQTSGAPLHLISVTLNQTRGKESNIVERDRRGRNLAIGPAGFAVSLERSTGCTRMEFDGAQENLPLSTWVGISGAAFSTGVGARSGFGLSTLAGLSNVRLGYWWRAGTGRPDRPVQWYLANELRGAFSGTDRARWYLSDGGHFDNTAIYELLRRRLRFILASDSGHDQAYAYEDVANLVRKARIDFGTEITFLERSALDSCLGASSAFRRGFGTLTQIAGLEPREPGAVAALARVEYPDQDPGTLVLLKPRLTGDGPIDLVRYKEENKDFPQQPTYDQFFDEAQWESYYVLGRLLTRQVMAPSDGPWSPGLLTPLRAELED
jgi:hypothetical protein